MADRDPAAECENALLAVRMVGGMLSGVATALRETKTRAEGFASSTRDAEAGAQKLSERVDALNETVGRIARHVGDIEAIALNTKILALNANIEAVRAGEAGRGFSVIATAVGQLARDASEATKQILAAFREIERASKDTRKEQQRLVHALAAVREGSLATAGTMTEQAEVTDAMLAYTTQAEEAIASVSKTMGEDTPEVETVLEDELEEGDDPCPSWNGATSSASATARSTRTISASSRW